MFNENQNDPLYIQRGVMKKIGSAVFAADGGRMQVSIYSNSVLHYENIPIQIYNVLKILPPKNENFQINKF